MEINRFILIVFASSLILNCRRRGYGSRSRGLPVVTNFIVTAVALFFSQSFKELTSPRPAPKEREV